MIFLDTHESEEIEKLLSKKLKVERYPLNNEEKADVWWMGVDGTYQMEYKSVVEILDNQDRVEAQLQKQYPNATYCYLVIRDVAMPTHRGVTVYRHDSKFKSIKYTKSHYMKYASWLEAVRTVGIGVIEVPTLGAMASRTISLYNLSQKVEHRTLHRYIRPKVSVKTKNPHIVGLMGLSHAFGLGLGEIKATKLIETYGTIHNIINMELGELCPLIGQSTAKKLASLKNPRATKPERRSAGGGLYVVLSKDGV